MAMRISMLRRDTLMFQSMKSMRKYFQLFWCFFVELFSVNVYRRVSTMVHNLIYCSLNQSEQIDFSPHSWFFTTLHLRINEGRNCSTLTQIDVKHNFKMFEYCRENNTTQIGFSRVIITCDCNSISKLSDKNPFVSKCKWFIWPRKKIHFSCYSWCEIIVFPLSFHGIIYCRHFISVHYCFNFIRFRSLFSRRSHLSLCVCFCLLSIRFFFFICVFSDDSLNVDDFESIFRAIKQQQKNFFHKWLNRIHFQYVFG